MTGRRCSLVGCTSPVEPAAARRLAGCCSEECAAELQLGEDGRDDPYADPPTDPMLRMPGAVARDADARAPQPTRRRWHIAAVVLVLAAVVTLYLRGTSGTENPPPATVSVPISTSAPPEQPTPTSASRTSRAKTTPTPSRTARPSRTTDPDLTELRSRARAAASEARERDG